MFHSETFENLPDVTAQKAHLIEGTRLESYHIRTENVSHVEL